MLPIFYLKCKRILIGYIGLGDQPKPKLVTNKEILKMQWISAVIYQILDFDQNTVDYA